VDVLIADTTPLMTAVYSDIYFADASLYASAALFQQQFSLTLVAATDLPWIADGLQRDGTAMQARVQARLRQALVQTGLAFHEVTGLGQARLSSALSAINLNSLR
jgi:nicotinamide riboside kinase